MKIRKVQYSVDYVHILTFSNAYRSIVGPYFNYENMEYSIENENTINETIKLIFRNEGFICQFRKEGVAFVFEGNIEEIKRQNPVLEIFFDIFEKIKKIPEFTKVSGHRIISEAVDIRDDFSMDTEIEKSMRNPFGKVEEFSTVFEFKKEEKDYHFIYGNFTQKDIKKFNISPLNTPYNHDLRKGVGTMYQVNIYEPTQSANFAKFKSLIKDTEEIIKTHKLRIS